MFTHVSMLHGLVDADHDVLVFLLERHDLDRHILINHNYWDDKDDMVS